MDIPYVDNSGFLGPCEQAISNDRIALYAGWSICIDLDAVKPGYPGRVVVDVRSGDRREFGSDFASSDPTRFPARIRAAATALYNCGCSGRFLITHSDGVLEITKASPGETP